MCTDVKPQLGPTEHNSYVYQVAHMLTNMCTTWIGHTR